FAAMLAAAGAPESGEAAAQGAALLVMHENALETRMVKPRFDADWRAMPAAAALVPGAVVLDTMDGFPAAGAGIKAGDAIREIGGQPVADAESAVRIIGESGGEPVEIALERWNGGEKSETIRVTLTPAMHDAGDGRGVRPVIGANLGGLSPGDIEKIEPLLAFGIMPAPVQSYVPPWSRYHAPADQLRGDLAAIWRIFGPIFGNRHKGELGRIATSLGGPVIILSSLWSWLLASFAAAMGFMRFLNVNLAIVNLLPVPVLDGGHVVFALWRGITGHEIPPKILNAIVNAFGVAIIALFVLLSGCDAMRLYLRFGA
ncbi:MAG: RIP metalloprotease, partial [Kiritimatiellae bacterium]|nr:RIP metalloprotease [Kiritimatiellia bacterium]